MVFDRTDVLPTRFRHHMANPALCARRRPRSWRTSPQAAHRADRNVFQVQFQSGKPSRSRTTSVANLCTKVRLSRVTCALRHHIPILLRLARLYGASAVHDHTETNPEHNSASVLETPPSGGEGFLPFSPPLMRSSCTDPGSTHLSFTKPPNPGGA
jgi:hypothetical protein